MTPYSRRNKPTPDILRYDMPELVRNRILSGFRYILEDKRGQGESAIWSVFRLVGKFALMQYGGLRSRGIQFFNHLPEQVEHHYFACTDEEAIDFLEWCFRFNEDLRNSVEFVNHVFREEGIGYEFSLYEPETDRYPEAIKKSDNLVHKNVVMPCLTILNSIVFTAASEEMLKAHEHYRHSDFREAIHSAGKSLESVLKTIIDKNGWGRDPKDALNALLKICDSQQLFDKSYVDVIQNSSGRIRNTYSGHGAGPSSLAVSEQMAAHMINLRHREKIN